MKYLITWSARTLGGLSDQRYYIGHVTHPTVINIDSATEISGAKAFNSRQNAEWIIKKIERRTADLGIIDIIEMTDKELFEARLKSK